MKNNEWINYIKGEARDNYIKKNCNVLKGYNDGKIEEFNNIDEKLFNFLFSCCQ